MLVVANLILPTLYTVECFNATYCIIFHKVIMGDKCVLEVWGISMGLTLSAKKRCVPRRVIANIQ